jgi:bifunctional DNase/RNase
MKNGERIESNDYYDLLVSQRHDNNISFPVLPNTKNFVCLVNKREYAVGIEFLRNESDIIKDILDKVNTKFAASKSEILIVDFTESVIISDVKDMEDEFNKLKKVIPSNRLAIILGIKFDIDSDNKLVKKSHSYMIRGKDFREIVDFENDFLKVI